MDKDVFMRVRNILLFSFFFFCQTLYADVASYSTLWWTELFIGPLSKDSAWKYYLQPRVILINDRYGYQFAEVYYGLGYTFNPTFTTYFGGQYDVTKNINGSFSHVNLIWQSFVSDIHRSEAWKLNHRSLFEELKNTLFPQWAWRLREEMTLKIPMFESSYSFMSFDEMFFNFNHPSWVSNKFFAENRFFIGIEKSMTKSVSFDIGYLNRFQFTRNPPNLLTNGLFLTLNVIEG